MEKVGKKWGKKHFAIKYFSSSRAIVVLVIFTLISYLVNKDRDENDTLLWSISKVNTKGIIAPKAHDTGLISKVATRAIAPLVASTLEHLAVGKAFGRRNGYAIDQSQELNYLGVTNLVNSFFGSMPVGGAMSRTAVNSECHVRSPLNGIVTSAWILLTIYVFSPALYWLPKATLSAIIVSHIYSNYSVRTMEKSILTLSDHGSNSPLRPSFSFLQFLAHLARRLHSVNDLILGNNLRIS